VIHRTVGGAFQRFTLGQLDDCYARFALVLRGARTHVGCKVTPHPVRQATDVWHQRTEEFKPRRVETGFFEQLAPSGIFGPLARIDVPARQL
jgi:hypothetical protein